MIQSSSYFRVPAFKKSVARVTLVIAVAAIFLSLLGLLERPGGYFNAIVQLGKSANGIILGTSIFVYILDIFWLVALCRKKRKDVVNNHASVGALKVLPTAIISVAFAYLDLNSHGRCCQVSKKWHQFSANSCFWKTVDLRTMLRVFDESDWAQRGLAVTDAPSLDKRKVIYAVKKCLFSFHMRFLSEYSGFTLLTIPKGLTLKRLPTLFPYANIEMFSSKSFGDTPPVNQTYRILISNSEFADPGYALDPIPFNSQNDAEAWINKKSCTLPKLLEVSALHVVLRRDRGPWYTKETTTTFCMDNAIVSVANGMLEIYLQDKRFPLASVMAVIRNV